MIDKVIKKIAIKVLRKMGYSPYMSEWLWKELKEDIFNTKICLKKRLWAYRRGFFSRRINEYGLNESNYKDYEPDFHYYKLHPLNEYRRWIDDKLTYKYILHPFSEYLPKYYFELRKGNVYKLMDCPIGWQADISSVIDLVRQEKQLAVKLVDGTGGEGFYKLSSNNGKYSVNNAQMDEDKLKKFLISLNRYIITEYLVSHPSIRRIYSVSPNTLRIIVVHNENEDPAIVGAIFRFGTSLTGVVDNIHAGGMACGVDIVSGVLYDPKFIKNNEWINSPEHIDTKVKIEGKLPHWDLIIKKIMEICEYLPQLKYMGIDIVITENGFRIIEINSHPVLSAMQKYYPLRKNKHVRRLFYKNEVQ